MKGRGGKEGAREREGGGGESQLNRPDSPLSLSISSQQRRLNRVRSTVSDLLPARFSQGGDVELTEEREGSDGCLVPKERQTPMNSKESFVEGREECTKEGKGTWLVILKDPVP